MVSISESEFSMICLGIASDRASIIKHNPIGTARETLLWMLLACLNSYLSLEEIETPCFTGRPDENTYRNAIMFVLRDRREKDFDPEPYIGQLLSHDN